MALSRGLLNIKTRLGLAKQLLIGLSLIGSLFAITSTLAESFWDYQRGITRSDAVISSIDSHYLPRLKQSIITADKYQLELIAKELYSLPEIQSLTVFNNWHELVSLGVGSASSQAITWPILTANNAGIKTVSEITVNLASPLSMATDFDHLRRIFSTQALLAIFILFGFYLYVKKSIIAPMRELACHVGEMDTDGLPKTIKLQSRIFKDEVTLFNQGYNNSVETIRNTFVEVSDRCLEAEEAKKRKSESMATVSHEIRTSLNGVFGLISLLKEKPSEIELKEYIGLLQNTAESLQDLVNDIHDLSQIEVGELSLSSGMINIAEMVEDIDASFRRRATEKELLFQCTVDSSINPQLVGDKARLRQVLRNLVSNAVKFTENGYVLLDIQHLAYDDDSETLLIEVKDSGIAKEQHETIFEQAFCEDSEGRTCRKNTGIRLGISRHLVRLMGGDLKIDSEPGLGSHFFFTLRLATHQDTQTKHEQNEEALPRVLVVDDSPFNMKITSLQLSKMGLDVHSCGDETQVIDLLAEAQREDQPFQLIVLDKNMPQIDGVDLAASLQQKLSEPIPAVLMISAEVLDYQDLKPHGIDSYLSRPYRGEELEQQVVDLLRPVVDQYVGMLQDKQPSSRDSAIQILLVEDQLSNQVVMKKMLQRLGVEVDIAKNGRIAVSKCAVNYYNLVFMDCQMPIMDGFEATMSIRKMEMGSTSRVPIVALTANVLAEEKNRCFESGMDGFVSKPVNFSKLSHTLRSHIATFEFLVEQTSSPFQTSLSSSDDKQTTHHGKM
ncbi:response regulator [Vibrio tapetis]|uniref:histidine kinase n=1 Tax=Vibrio tapetis subsp. tapetis TaxID=1671868 RepID=A0A2N8ZK66_9VIBR|nr:response regulator [Vibrio tapetis]SON52266.1 putative TWO-COMPONENT SENSOR PROTEIN HISTIDINE PROTEIN KINASE (DHKK, DHKJ) [Vibrio tapetis subsp. tapetis]